MYKNEKNKWYERAINNLKRSTHIDCVNDVNGNLCIVRSCWKEKAYCGIVREGNYINVSQLIRDLFDIL